MGGGGGEYMTVSRDAISTKKERKRNRGEAEYVPRGRIKERRWGKIYSISAREEEAKV